MTDSARDLIAERFEEERPRLEAIAYRMLGSASEAEDAVQEAWLRLDRRDGAALDNLAGWLTTVVARLCLDQLRARRARREDTRDWSLPDPVVSIAGEGGADPEAEALMADAAGLALMVVLDELDPPERLAFVLHDVFAVPFEEIAPVVGRSPAATRQLASRARRRVRGAAPSPDADVAAQRRIVDALRAAVREGDMEAVVELLDPDVVLRVDPGPGRGRRRVSGVPEVARQLVSRGAGFAPLGRSVLVNGAAGVAIVVSGRLIGLAAFTVAGGRIAAIDILADPERLSALDVPLA